MSPDDPAGYPAFATFLDSVRDARHESFTPPGGTGDDEQGGVGEAAFTTMQAHILDLYDGVQVEHSFVDDSGQVFDCVPIEQQPSLRGHGAPATAPDAPTPQAAPGGAAEQDTEMPADAGSERSVEPQLGAERVDRFGQAMACPPGTIAMRRVTLEEVSGTGDLREFFRKAPGGGRQHPRLGAEGITPYVHKYAHAYEVADNLGGHSALSMWAPNVGSQIFSLSQQWYAGGSPVQTVEIGWQVYPGKYGTTNPCLFIYWTADGYDKTGNYNLDAKAFVQTNGAWVLGGAVGPLSSFGGAQYSLELTAYLSGGNWWLYVGGTSAANAIGYYPASQYGAGPLATHASDVDYGGEVVNVTAWPPMGSGAFANAGWGQAAYQRDVYLFPTAGGARQASLTTSQPSPSCFTIDLHTTSAPWNEYFFFGGPGGTGCE